MSRECTFSLVLELFLKHLQFNKGHKNSWFSRPHFILFYFILFFFKLLNLFLVVLGLRCCTRAFSSCSERGPLFPVVRRPLTAVASPAAEHGL